MFKLVKKDEKSTPNVRTFKNDLMCIKKNLMSQIKIHIAVNKRRILKQILTNRLLRELKTLVKRQAGKKSSLTLP